MHRKVLLTQVLIFRKYKKVNVTLLNMYKHNLTRIEFCTIEICVSRKPQDNFFTYVNFVKN